MSKKNLVVLVIILIGFFSFLSCSNTLKKDDPYTESYFKGVSNAGKTADKTYFNAGDKAYIVGTQDGMFPDWGGHLEGEMGGIWTQPIKLMDGFWLKLADIKDNSEEWLIRAKDFRAYPHAVEFLYDSLLNGIEVSRLQYAPDGYKGVVIEFKIKNKSDKERNLGIDFFAKTDLLPVWFSKENNIIDYEDIIKWDESRKVFVAKDSINNWFAVWGTDNGITSYSTEKSLPFKTKGKGKTGTINSVIKLGPDQEKIISYVVAGSVTDQQDALETYNEIISKKSELLGKKKDLYKNILLKSKVSIPDKELETAYNWIKINTEWLKLDLDGYGRFLCAGAIEYPWLFGCDNTYALQGVLATGDFELVKSTLTLLKNVSEKENGNGRIIHEMSSNGFVSNKGSTQETAHYISVVWKAFEWTGDMDFLKDIYPYAKKGIDWLLTKQDKNGNLFPEGYGIAEVKGLNAELIDVAVYTQQALESMAKMAALFGETSLSKEYDLKASLLKEKINTEFWDDAESIYCDFYSTREDALSVANGAIEQINMLLPEDKNREIVDTYKSLISDFSKYPPGTTKGWFTNKYWIINTPLETGIAPSEKAIRSLEKIRNEHCGEYGPYLSATEKLHMMTISTGVQAMSEAQYGRTDECLMYMKKIASTLGKTYPGSINEMMPDYGCPVQAWTIYSIATPLITHIFGIKPDSYNKQILIKPNIPTGWQNMSIENQRVGNNIYDIKLSKNENTIEYIIISKETDWNTILVIKGLSSKEYEINGIKRIAESDQIVLKGSTNVLILKN